MSDQINHPPSASELLQQARLAQELTLDQVSLQTRIPRDLIQALEEKNWALLPGAPYARAFCKTLAQAYGLDQELVLSGLRNDMGMPVTKTPARSVVEIGVTSTKDESRASKTPLLMAGLLAVALVLVLAATRFAFHSAAPAPASVSDSAKADSLENDSTPDPLVAASLAPAALPVVAVNRRLVTLKLVDAAHPAFILYMRQGLARIRKKSLTGTDTLDFDPDTALWVRNLSKQPLRLAGGLSRDTVSQTYFRVLRRNDTIRFEPVSESNWDEKTSAIMERKKQTGN